MPNSRAIYFNPNGTAVTGFFQSFAPAGAYRFTEDLTGTKWKKTRDGLLNQNFQDAFLVLPLERAELLHATRSTRSTTRSVSLRRACSAGVETKTVQQPSPSVNGWAAFIPVDGRAVPTELSQILASRTNPTGDWRLTYYLNYANRDLRADRAHLPVAGGPQGPHSGDGLDVGSVRLDG